MSSNRPKHDGSKSYIPQKLCREGKHFYPGVFVSCPTHSVRLRNWNVRVRTKYYTIRKPDGSMTNDWTFQQKAETGMLAARAVIHALFESREAAEFHVRGRPEVWLATKEGVPKADIWRGG